MLHDLLHAMTCSLCSVRCCLAYFADHAYQVHHCVSKDAHCNRIVMRMNLCGRAGFANTSYALTLTGCSKCEAAGGSTEASTNSSCDSATTVSV
jgi:hypothetical protein